ncbi:hypothetical protein LXA43DRAFT_1102289 [Ganoderma leucocontextum]|nr:hypothetical protein LXA43DRAFT_1102289 [Ganoderma leucocontextum]
MSTSSGSSVGGSQPLSPAGDDDEGPQVGIVSEKIESYLEALALGGQGNFDDDDDEFHTIAESDSIVGPLQQLHRERQEQRRKEREEALAKREKKNAKKASSVTTRPQSHTQSLRTSVSLIDLQSRRQQSVHIHCGDVQSQRYSTGSLPVRHWISSMAGITTDLTSKSSSTANYFNVDKHCASFYAALPQPRRQPSWPETPAVGGMLVVNSVGSESQRWEDRSRRSPVRLGTTGSP